MYWGGVCGSPNGRKSWFLRGLIEMWTLASRPRSSGVLCVSAEMVWAFFAVVVGCLVACLNGVLVVYWEIYIASKM